jgi:hypothetical protein
MSLNIEFQPIVPDRNYAPTRTFITKWDVEIDNNRAKKIARRRDRTAKYFDHFEHADLPLDLAGHITCNRAKSLCDEVEQSDDESEDGEGEETHQMWLRSVRAENEYYDKKYKPNNWYDMNAAELDAHQHGDRKRVLFSDEIPDFKRVRA